MAFQGLNTPGIVSMQNYKEEFDPSVYLTRYEATSSSELAPLVKYTLQCYHEAFETLSKSLKVLDYGAGPVIANTITAATKSSEIVLAEYSEHNRVFLHQWLNGDSAAFDWTPHFNYVVQELEGITASEEEVKKRQELVRKLVKNVVDCDIRRDPPIQRGYDQPYDVVMCSLVIGNTSKDYDEYCSHVARLGKLVKPGGTLLFHDVENSDGYYSIGDCKFPNVYVTHESALKAFEDAGFCDLTLKLAPKFNAYPSCTFRFIMGRHM